MNGSPYSSFIPPYGTPYFPQYNPLKSYCRDLRKTANRLSWMVLVSLLYHRDVPAVFFFLLPAGALIRRFRFEHSVPALFPACSSVLQSVCLQIIRPLWLLRFWSSSGLMHPCRKRRFRIVRSESACTFWQIAVIPPLVEEFAFRGVIFPDCGNTETALPSLPARCSLAFSTETRFSFLLHFSAG